MGDTNIDPLKPCSNLKDWDRVEHGWTRFWLYFLILSKTWQKNVVLLMVGTSSPKKLFHMKNSLYKESKQNTKDKSKSLGKLWNLGLCEISKGIESLVLNRAHLDQNSTSFQPDICILIHQSRLTLHVPCMIHSDWICAHHIISQTSSNPGNFNIILLPNLIYQQKSTYYSITIYIYSYYYYDYNYHYHHHSPFYSHLPY